jgi:hypothetical protein
MSPQTDLASGLDLELCLTEFLGRGEALDVIEQLLRARAPQWSSHLSVWPTDVDGILVESEGSFRKAVLTGAIERGPLYRQLVESFGPGDERVFGTVEVRGADPSLTVVVDLDERILIRGGQNFGNSIDFEVRSSPVDGAPAAAWMEETCRKACLTLPVAWARAGTPGEYWAKAMSTTPRIQAIGRDFSRYLPGLFWLNFFGKQYCDLIGEEKLLQCPASSAERLGDGILVVLYEDPYAWQTNEYQEKERETIDDIGTLYFFSKDHPDRITVAPSWSSFPPRSGRG